jgi:hypothetical protein
LKFLVLGWATSIGYFGSTAAGDLLPIKSSLRHSQKRRIGGFRVVALIRYSQV